MNISPLNIFPNMLLDKRYHQNHQAVLAAMSINRLSALEESSLSIGMVNIWLPGDNMEMRGAQLAFSALINSAILLLTLFECEIRC